MAPGKQIACKAPGVSHSQAPRAPCSAPAQRAGCHHGWSGAASDAGCTRQVFTAAVCRRCEADPAEKVPLTTKSLCRRSSTQSSLNTARRHGAPECRCSTVYQPGTSPEVSQPKTSCLKHCFQSRGPKGQRARRPACERKDGFVVAQPRRTGPAAHAQTPCSDPLPCSCVWYRTTAAAQRLLGPCAAPAWRRTQAAAVEVSRCAAAATRVQPRSTNCCLQLSRGIMGRSSRVQPHGGVVT